MKQLKLSLSPNYRKMYQLGAKLFPLYERLWNGYDYLLSLHLMELITYVQMMMSQEGRKFILEEDFTGIVETTLKHLAVTHGVDHKTYKKCEKFANDYKELIELQKMLTLNNGISLLNMD